MDPKWYVLVNPASGKGRAVKRWEELRKEFDRHALPYDFVVSEHRGHATTLVQNARSKGYSRFVSVGGDGTHHEVLNGILPVVSTEDVPLLALVNAGTGNDVSRMHKIPRNIEDCASMISAENTVLHSAGHVTYTYEGQSKQRYFLNVAGMAFDGRVVETLPESFRNHSILPAYLIAGLKQLFTYRAPEILVSSETKTLRDRFITVHAGICKYTGGGMRFVPHADPLAPELAITCLRNMHIIRLLASIYRLYTGTLISHPMADGFTCKEIRIISPDGKSIPLEADGEFLGYAPISISIVPNAFRLVVP